MEKNEPRPKRPLGRNIYPFGKPKTPFNPATGAHFPLVDQSQIKLFIFSVDMGNMIHCYDENGENVLVVKPYAIRNRQTFYSDGLTYNQISPRERFVHVDNGYSFYEIVQPYITGEEILAARCDISAGLGLNEKGETWYDLNTAGRCWTRVKDFSEFVELTLSSGGAGNDTITCEDGDGNTVYVAKPYDLRRTPFDGETVNNISYSYSDANTRTSSKAGNDDETEIITPAYYEDEVICAQRLNTGLTVSGTDVDYIEFGCTKIWAVQQ